MSMGLNALRGAIDNGSMTFFRSMKRVWFVDDELPAYDFIRAHVKRYSRLPDLKTVRENGFVLPTIKEKPKYYVDRISERAVYNAVQEQHADLLSAMRGRDVPLIKQALSEMIIATRIVENKQDYSTLTEQSATIREEYREAKRRPGLQGIPLGYGPLDEITNGAQGGDVIVIAGRPNKGKSYKLLSMMAAAHNAGFAPAVCSMEMTSKQLALRYIGMTARLNPDLIRRGELSTTRGEPIFMSTLERITNMPPVHFLEGNFRKSVADVDALTQQFTPDILYIDAGYLLRAEKENKNYSKSDQIGEVMQDIKTMAHDRNIPVVMTVQLNRDAARVGKKGLDLAFLAGTDIIGQAATVVVGLMDGRPPYETMTRQCQVIKNREGKLLTYGMNFMFSPMDFSYLVGSEMAEPLPGAEETPEDAAAVANEVREMEEQGWER